MRTRRATRQTAESAGKADVVTKDVQASSPDQPALVEWSSRSSSGARRIETWILEMRVGLAVLFLPLQAGQDSMLGHP